MEVYVNGNKVEITLENETTVGEVLKAFENEAAKNDATTIGISVDGKNVLPEELDSMMSKSLTDSTKIELSVISKNEIQESLVWSGNNLEDLSEKIKEVPVLLQTGKVKDASALITDLAEGIDAFCHCATLCALFPDAYNSLKIDGKNIAEFFEEFAPIIADFENAFKDNDTVTVGDLCEYEISPRLKSISLAVKNI